MRRQTLVRDGVSLGWYDSGGSGTPILFQHGLCGDINQTREAVPASLRLITLECRAHGASETGLLNNLSIATFAADIAALITELGLGPIILGGISMGAALATRLAVYRPDLVHALALVRPAWLAAAAPPNMQPNAEVGALLAQMPVDAARAAFRASPTYGHLAKTAPDNLASLMGFFQRTPITTTAALLQAIAADGPGITEPDLAALTIPTLVIGTQHDAIHPWSMAKRLAALIPGAKLLEATPKSIDKPGYLADLHTALAAFSEEI
ncbi:alpha/beta hydrolase [Devosia yakushimensis]|uniref:Alpha/beta hydrolase n=1 Tax=Devosia yakushimensis TaxID=470028 RepID=A0ABQ5UGA9_9HYPH|nr:alpha/beta hydrolase [Devosia yakushimensis]GLQ10693.1 alpha/beta hydrolase [Devosia yakushimensis]